MSRIPFSVVVTKADELCRQWYGAYCKDSRKEPMFHFMVQLYAMKHEFLDRGYEREALESERDILIAAKDCFLDDPLVLHRAEDMAQKFFRKCLNYFSPNDNDALEFVLRHKTDEPRSFTESVCCAIYNEHENLFHPAESKPTGLWQSLFGGRK